jgi:cytochrome P450 family 110
MKPIPTVEAASGLRLIMRRIKAILRPIHFIEERDRRYGDFYQVKFKNAPATIMTSNPQAIEAIFTASSDRFKVGRGNRVLAFLVGNNSLLLLDGKTYKNR